jgi:U3 small nucleolar RNA-associated protein 14
VLISEKYDRKLAAHGAAALPFPYRSAEEFEASRSAPLGRERNTDRAFRDLTRPKVTRHAGAVIAPLRYTKPKDVPAAAAGGGKRKR